MASLFLAAVLGVLVMLALLGGIAAVQRFGERSRHLPQPSTKAPTSSVDVAPGSPTNSVGASASTGQPQSPAPPSV
jgi:hypothetical protein